MSPGYTYGLDFHWPVSYVQMVALWYFKVKKGRLQGSTCACTCVCAHMHVYCTPVASALISIKE